MSEPRDIRDVLRAIIGEDIPGGCERCDAYQRNEEVAPGVFILHIYHDDWCPIHGTGK